MKLTFEVPVKAISSLNARLHWRVRARKVKAERVATAMAMHVADRQAYPHTPGLPMPRGYAPPEMLATITLTRIGPRKLDSDNVQGALKAIRDEVAAQLGIDDGDERLEWLYEQEKGAYAVRVCIETREAVAARVYSDVRRGRVDLCARCGAVADGAETFNVWAVEGV